MVTGSPIVRDTSGRMLPLRQQRDFLDAAVARHLDQFSGEVFQVAQALILCGLPYQPTLKTSITRRAILADGSRVSVTFSTALEGQMPYGSDRTLLHFILDRAIKARSRFVRWDTATEYLAAMKLAPGGKNRRDLKNRFLRIRGLTIGVARSGVAGVESEIMPIIRRSLLPPSVDTRRKATRRRQLPFAEKAEFGVEIDEGFFKELERHHVPIPQEVIRATRKQSQLQDMILFLCWRCYAAQSESLIPWKYLREQLWQEDSNLRRIRQRFDDAIKLLQTLWPEMRAVADRRGLRVGPPRNRRYLTAQATSTRRL